MFLGCSNDTFCKFGGGSHRGFSFTGLILGYGVWALFGYLWATAKMWH
jgi:hypothetical protein